MICCQRVRECIKLLGTISTCGNKDASFHHLRRFFESVVTTVKRKSILLTKTPMFVVISTPSVLWYMHVLPVVALVHVLVIAEFWRFGRLRYFSKKPILQVFLCNVARLLDDCTQICMYHLSVKWVSLRTINIFSEISCIGICTDWRGLLLIHVNLKHTKQSSLCCYWDKNNHHISWHI